MTADFAARRGIVDRESGAASALAARKEMTSRAVRGHEKVPTGGQVVVPVGGQ